MVQGNLQGLPVAAHCLDGVTGGQSQAQVQQQLITFGIGRAALLQAALKQGDGLVGLAFADQQTPQLGAGVGITGPLLQISFHGLSQPIGLIAARQQLGSVAFVEDRWLTASGDAPLGFRFQQGANAVVNHCVVEACSIGSRGGAGTDD